MAVITKRLGVASFHNLSLVIRYRLIELKIEERDGFFRSMLFKTAAQTAYPFEPEQGAIKMEKTHTCQTTIASNLRCDKSRRQFRDNVTRTLKRGTIFNDCSCQFIPQATLESGQWYTMQAQSLLAVLWLTDLVAFSDDKSPLQAS